MRPKSIIALIAVVGLSLVIGSGCRIRNRSGRTESGQSAQTPADSSAAFNDDKQVELTISAKDDSGFDLAERQEIHRKFELKPGALVSVYRISGKVTVTSGDGNTAEVIVVRSARKREDLQYRQIRIEQNPDGFLVRGENDRKSVFSALGSIPDGRQRIIMKLPRKVDFETSGISGDLNIGELDGRVEVRGVSGGVKIGRASGDTEISGINGSIDATFGQMIGHGIEVRGVNGNVDLRFEGVVNANLDARNINGNIDADLSNLEKTGGEEGRGRLKARIGSGGAEIDITGVNGNVRLGKAEKPNPSATKVAKK